MSHIIHSASIEYKYLIPNNCLNSIANTQDCFCFIRKIYLKIARCKRAPGFVVLRYFRKQLFEGFSRHSGYYADERSGIGNANFLPEASCLILPKIFGRSHEV